jgi:hypothetical protein
MKKLERASKRASDSERTHLMFIKKNSVLQFQTLDEISNNTEWSALAAATERRDSECACSRPLNRYFQLFVHAYVCGAVSGVWMWPYTEAMIVHNVPAIICT